MSSELCLRPATAIAAAVAAGEVSAAAVVEAHLDRIAALQPALNAFVDVDADRARVAARDQDDRAARGDRRGLLGGVPVSVKSAIDVAGLRCETGSESRAGTIAPDDAVAVARLRGAGAIVLGTTNVAEMLMGYESVNPLHGRTRNPWDPARTPGGSSGGESAAIAAGCSAAGLGSDGGGSIRVPAHFTGICGLKPTPGRVPATGHQPACLGPFSLIGAVGPMARTVADVEALYRVLSGWDTADPCATPLAAEAALPDRDGWRVGWFEAHPAAPVSNDTAAAVRHAAAALEAQGMAVEPYCPPVLDRVAPLWRAFFCEMGETLLRASLGRAARELPILQAHFAAEPERAPLDAAGLALAWIDRDLARAELLEAMALYPVLVCPVSSVPAFRHDERGWRVDGREVGYLDAMVYTQWFNVLGNPAAVVPVGTSPEGVPIGVQVVGRPFEEVRVLRVAAAIERGCGGYVPPPMAR
jgi:amidase